MRGEVRYCSDRSQKWFSIRVEKSSTLPLSFEARCRTSLANLLRTAQTPRSLNFVLTLIPNTNTCPSKTHSMSCLIASTRFFWAKSGQVDSFAREPKWYVLTHHTSPNYYSCERNDITYRKLVTIRNVATALPVRTRFCSRSSPKDVNKPKYCEPWQVHVVFAPCPVWMPISNEIESGEVSEQRARLPCGCKYCR